VITSQLWGYFKDQKDISAADELAAVKKYWLEDHKLTMPIAVDVGKLVPNKRDSTKMMPEIDRIGRSLFAFAYPTFFLIDRDGVIRKRFVGFNEASVTAEVEKLIGQKASKPATPPKP
jgi:peroxiredoxin